MSASTDVESQSPAARPRGRCLDTFLVASVVALFVMFAVALPVALLFAKHIESEMNTQRSGGSTDSTMSAMHGVPASSYKMQSFAYLEVTEAQLKAGMMHWEPVTSAGPSVGSLYSFHKDSEALIVNEGGVYFLYLQLNFSCTYICQSGHFTVNFYSEGQKRELSCSASLPAQHQPGSTPLPAQHQYFSHTCWNVITFPEKGNRLLAKAEFRDKLDNWKLEFVNSGFGIFQIDRLVAGLRT